MGDMLFHLKDRLKKIKQDIFVLGGVKKWDINWIIF